MSKQREPGPSPLKCGLFLFAVLSSCAKSSSSSEAPVLAAVPRGYDAQPKMKTKIIHLALRTPLQLSGELAGAIELISYVIEQIEASPDNPESYPAGSGVVMALMLEGSTLELSDLSEGYESESIGWTNSYKVTLLSHDSKASTVDLQVQRIGDADATPAGPSTRIERGASLAFGEGWAMIFQGHGHKRVYEGQTSPLMVGLEFQKAGQEVLQVTHHVYPPDATTWRFRDFEFDMRNHEYDRFMELQVRRLVLHPVTAQ